MNALARLAPALALIAGTTAASAQTLPPVRPIGPLLATSSEPMVAVSQVRALPGGRVLVNDNTGLRVLLFDSTLAHFTVVADTTAYGATIGGLIAWHGDSTLFVDPVLLSMLVMDANGKIVRTVAATAKVPFDWERLNDADKTAILDSTERAMKAASPDIVIRSASSPNADTAHHVLRRLPPPDATVPRNTGVAGGRPINTSRVTEFVSLDEMPDYRPPFRLAAARGDADGNLWIRTTRIVDGGAVYDVINRQGVLIDRILVPPGRVIAGFGPGGVVYMGVLDGTVARLERAQVHMATHP